MCGGRACVLLVTSRFVVDNDSYEDDADGWTSGAWDVDLVLPFQK